MKSLYFKISFICILFVFKYESIEAQGQPWVENNALWIYQFNPYGLDVVNGAYEIKKVGDSLMGTNVCDVLIRKIYVVFNQDGPEHYVGIVDSAMFFTYKSPNGDSIYYSRDSVNFNLLFDFSKSSGDSVLYDVVDLNSGFYECLDSNYYKIAIIDTIVYSGQEYVNHHIGILKCDSVSSSFNLRPNYWDYCDDFPIINLNERFGISSYGFLFPERHGFCAENPGSYQSLISSNYPPQLYCFKDDSLEVGQYCDFMESLKNPEYFRFNKIQISPNPFNSSFVVSNLNDEVRIEIINEQGKILQSKTVTGGNEEISLEANSGFYFVKITSKSERSICKKIVKL